MYHHNSRVKVVHNIPFAPNVDVIVDNKIVLSNVAYKKVSDYLSVPSGPHHLAIAANGTVLAQANVNLKSGADYTVIAHGNVADLKSIALLPLEDDNTCPKAGKAHVRFIHAAAKVPAVDIWANNKLKVFTNVAYGSTGKPVYLPVDAGDISLSVTPAKTNNVVLGPIDLNLESGNVYTIIATGLLNDRKAPLDVILTTDSHCHTVHTWSWW